THPRALDLAKRERGGTGRRAGLRILWGNPSGFDSRRSHLPRPPEGERRGLRLHTYNQVSPPTKGIHRMESIRIAPLQPRVTSRSRHWPSVVVLGVLLSGVGLTAACGDESEPPAASPESPTNEQSPLPGIMAEGACVE